jgi:hypothetical protein
MQTIRKKQKESKTKVTRIKNDSNASITRHNAVEERVSEFEERSIETSQIKLGKRKIPERGKEGLNRRNT